MLSNPLITADFVLFFSLMGVCAPSYYFDVVRKFSFSLHTYSSELVVCTTIYIRYIATVRTEGNDMENIPFLLKLAAVFSPLDSAAVYCTVNLCTYATSAKF